MTRVVLGALLAFPALLAAESSGNCLQPFESAISGAKEIAMDIRAGDIQIVGSPHSRVRVTCSMKDSDSARDVRISFAANHLRVTGGPDRDFRLRIEVPERIGLYVRCSAGDMNVGGITGDKDVEMRAGDLTISVGNPESYRVAEGSVLAGDLVASAFGVSKDGLFRSFRKDNAQGQYRLHARLLAGDLTLK